MFSPLSKLSVPCSTHYHSSRQQFSRRIHSIEKAANESPSLLNTPLFISFLSVDEIVEWYKALIYRAAIAAFKAIV